MRRNSGIMMGRLHHGRFSRECAKPEGRDQASLLKVKETRDRARFDPKRLTRPAKKMKLYNGAIVGDKSREGRKIDRREGGGGYCQPI